MGICTNGLSQMTPRWQLNDSWITQGWLPDDVLTPGWLQDDSWMTSGWYLNDSGLTQGWLPDEQLDSWTTPGRLLDDSWTTPGRLRVMTPGWHPNDSWMIPRWLLGDSHVTPGWLPDDSVCGQPKFLDAISNVKKRKCACFSMSILFVPIYYFIFHLKTPQPVLV